MSKFDFDIGVIGGGAAGLTVAAGASQLGLKTLIIEKEQKLGGDCLHYGCVPSKTLIKSATVYHTMKNAERFGLPQPEIPPVDFNRIAKRIQTVIETIQVHDSEERFCGLGAKVSYGHASFVDDHTVEVSCKRISARFWLIATGASPASPPIKGLEPGSFWTNKDIFSLNELPSSLAVIGGGPIGCEMAQAFSRLGTDVHIIQRNSQLLPVEDEDMAGMVQTGFEDEGINVILSADIQSVRTTSDRVEIEYATENRPQVLSAEKMLVATGRAPNVDGLGLHNAGVEYDDRGIKVDERLRTSQKHIFAAGDVIGRNKFTHAAGYEGSIVISNVAFRLPRKVDYTWLPWCTYTDPELASVGMNEKRAKKAEVEHTTWVEHFADNDRAQTEGAVEGRIKLVLGKKDRPLGVQIVGPHAGDIASEWVAALNAKIGLTALASAIHQYPTMSEINKRVAGQVLSEKLFSDKVRKTLGFIFDYKGRACALD